MGERGKEENLDELGSVIWGRDCWGREGEGRGKGKEKRTLQDGSHKILNLLIYSVLQDNL